MQRQTAYADGRARGTTGGGAMTSARFTVARIVRAIAAIVALIIVAGILLVVLEANTGNGIVSAVLDAARWLVGPFEGLFTVDDRKVEVAVNWGLAAVVYYAVGHLIAKLIAR
jgi:hypothetical protein